MKRITIIWLIFTVMFFCLGIVHVFFAQRDIPPFKIKAQGSVGKINGIPVHTGFKNFVKDFNSYLDDQNRSARSQNRVAVVGYFAASLTAFFSMVLTIDRWSDWLNNILKKKGYGERKGTSLKS